ncbi:SET and MYND domain-containing protein 4 [Linnemannia schmuckeri]|uniref:SET and MYND domain-containing protein 4 n=1 Tax=Linnemannia schmuckeri TaxID=64567 RepID=A0A9P5VCL9_9FUNG|nr:SET and MYND domain-containing protein 4 [Linnemannia schmuckeri]
MHHQRHNHSHGHGHGHDHHHDPKTNTYRERLRQAANKSKTLEEIVSNPAAACFQPNDLTRLLAMPTYDYSAVKEAFNSRPCIKSRSRTWAPPAGPDPLLKLSQGTTTAGLTAHASTKPTTTTIRRGSIATSVEHSKLDAQFRVGFSMAYGHSIELNMENEVIKGGDAIDSGTYIFDRDELPYASVIDKDWRGKLCEECLRKLPKEDDDNAVLECRSCPRLTDGSGGRGEDLDLGPAKFCSRECLEQAWRTWHGYECKFMEELDQFEQDTRLALRIFWRNSQEGVRLVIKESSETSNNNIDTLTSKAAGLSLNNINSDLNKIDEANRKPRVHSKDGSQISIQELYHNFDRLAPKAQMAFLIKAHYLQELMGLSKNAARELAQIQALIKFNCFAIKSKIYQDAGDGGRISHQEEYAVGSGVYLLASMFNHSCAPNAMVVFGVQAKTSLRGELGFASSGGRGVDPRVLNVLTSKSLKAYGSVPAQVEISYGPTGGRMPTEERKECLRQKYAETFRKRVFKCQKGSYACRPMLDDEDECPTCGEKVDRAIRNKMMQLIAQLLGDTSNPSLPLSRRLTLLKTLEVSQSRLFVDTYIIYGHTCDQLAMVYTQSGDLGQGAQWCRKALKAVMVNFPHDSIEVAQETLKLAGLLFNNQQHKEALKHVQAAIVLYRGHYGAKSKEPDLLELYKMEEVLQPIVEKYY